MPTTYLTVTSGECWKKLQSTEPQRLKGFMAIGPVSQHPGGKEFFLRILSLLYNNTITQKVKTAPAQNPETHIDNRTYESVSSRKVDAFQFDNPQLHQYYADAARGLLSDLRNSTRGERGAIRDEDGDITGSWGTKRNTTDAIERLLDNVDLSYAQIEKALNDLIENHGQENYAAAKKVELVLDDLLTNGGTDIDGRPFEANQEYIEAKSKIPGSQTSTAKTESTGNGLDDLDDLVAWEERKHGRPLPEGMGAASTGFDPYSALQNKYGTIEQGEAPRARFSLLRVVDTSSTIYL
jgi:hypothetical protein